MTIAVQLWRASQCRLRTSAMTASAPATSETGATVVMKRDFVMTISCSVRDRIVEG